MRGCGQRIVVMQVHAGAASGADVGQRALTEASLDHRKVSRKLPYRGGMENYYRSY
jgi:hypothetical protein